MFERIMVPLDGSELAERALACTSAARWVGASCCKGSSCPSGPLLNSQTGTARKCAWCRSTKRRASGN